MSTIKHSEVRSIEEHWRNGVTRILVATSAWGMGINDRRVEMVVQWRVKDLGNLVTLYQRFDFARYLFPFHGKRIYWRRTRQIRDRAELIHYRIALGELSACVKPF